MRRSSVLFFAALLLVQLPWLTRPVDFDEANFLTLARGAVADPWRPHDVLINWQGTTERAFDVLSNPPGIAWWLAPVVDAPVPIQRAWMLPWLALAVWGARRLAERFTPDTPDATALALLCSPIVLLSAPSLLPDAPLYACTLAGVAGFVDATDRHRSPLVFALLAGCAGLFRYSGLALAPLLGLYAVLRGRPPWPALGAWVPLGLLAVHDQLAYGAWHLAAMGRFQSVSNTGEDLAHKATAALAMLGGVGVLPLFARGWRAAVGAAVGAALGVPYGAVGMAFAAAGGAVLTSAIGAPGEAREDRWWLAAWAGGGFVFLLTLRFVAARYWLPFLPGVALALPAGRHARLALVASVSLGMALAADENAQAVGVKRLADSVADLGTGLFTGHWGWQWELERKGWQPMEEGERAPRGALVALPHDAWPQEVAVDCNTVVWSGSARPPLPWLPRGYTERGRANLHANWIAGPPMTRSVIPWTFANDPYERVRVCRE